MAIFILHEPQSLMPLTVPVSRSHAAIRVPLLEYNRTGRVITACYESAGKLGMIYCALHVSIISMLTCSARQKQNKHNVKPGFA